MLFPTNIKKISSSNFDLIYVVNYKELRIISRKKTKGSIKISRSKVNSTDNFQLYNFSIRFQHQKYVFDAEIIAVSHSLCKLNLKVS